MKVNVPNTSIGNCPNDKNTIKCCDTIRCSSNDIDGVCTFKDECKGNIVTNKCPGNSNFVCCIPRTTSTDGKCGKSYGLNCPPGECCSKAGWCGVTKNHCNLSKGCQSKYGLCNKDTTTKKTTKKKKLLLKKLLKKKLLPRNPLSRKQLHQPNYIIIELDKEI